MRKSSEFDREHLSQLQLQQEKDKEARHNEILHDRAYRAQVTRFKKACFDQGIAAVSAQYDICCNKPGLLPKVERLDAAEVLAAMFEGMEKYREEIAERRLQ